LATPRDHLRNKFFKKKQMTALAELRHFESIKMELKGAKIYSNFILYFISTLSHRELDSNNYRNALTLNVTFQKSYTMPCTVLCNFYFDVVVEVTQI
jgi:hypothetical protein